MLPRAMPRSRPTLPVVVFLLVLSLTACSKDDGSVSISGDVAGLDTLAFRGDLLIAQANRPLGEIDTAQLNLALQDSAPGSGTLGDPSTSRESRAGSLGDAVPSTLGANEMSRRAVARGDSMARAEAQRLVGNRGGSARADGDTVRGVVTLTGVEPARQPALRSGNAVIALSGLATRGITRLEGMDIMIRGFKVTPRDVVVSDYVVRAVGGVPAFDGRLEAAGGGWNLRLTDGTGRKRIPVLPASLRGMSGARVWIAMPEGSTPTAYGMISNR